MSLSNRSATLDGAAELARSLAQSFDDPTTDADRFEADCRRLGESLPTAPGEADVATLLPLLPALRKPLQPLVPALFGLFERLARALADPWPILAGLLAVHDGRLFVRALDLVAETDRERLPPDAGALTHVARLIDADADRLRRAPEALERLERLVHRFTPAARGDPALRLYLGAADLALRRLAARLLDRDGRPVRPGLARRVLGTEAWRVLGPCLAYTRATHLDLLHLAPGSGMARPLLEQFRAARRTCGPELLPRIVGALGWGGCNLGLQVEPYAAVSIRGSLPFHVLTWEAPLLEACPGARRLAEGLRVVGHGGDLGGSAAGEGSVDAVSRFRGCNLVHAELLDLLLDVAPLSVESARDLLRGMDRVVEDFVALFASDSEECSILPAVYGELKQRILAGLEREADGTALSADLTRLVQMFEDPRSIGQAHTLHGLKRYLHQRGLELGRRLVGRCGGANRSVHLLLASQTEVLQTIQRIRYADFEPAEPVGTAGLPAIPYPVRVVVDGFGRQLLHGHTKFPDVDVLCYGNEVHYYVAFRNHPAFVRIDYAPPLRGGIVDLEYYGVSNYELDDHPAPALEAIQAALRRFDFDVRVDGALVHARYDKERALDLETLCAKAEQLLQLTPFLMDLDWTIGSLDLDAAARAKVAAAWAERLALWGALPVERLLTRDRRGILVAVEDSVTGRRELRWSGDGPYADRFGELPSLDDLAAAFEALRQLRIDGPPALAASQPRIGQLQLERSLLLPLRDAVRYGAVRLTPAGPRRASPRRFRGEHETECFARMLHDGVAECGRGVAVARTLAPFERTLRFVTTGSVQGCAVERTQIGLRGEKLTVAVLRDSAGMARLGLFARGTQLFRRRLEPGGPWVGNAETDAAALATLLRRADYVTPGQAPAPVTEHEAAEIRSLFAAPSSAGSFAGGDDERRLRGLPASAGRATGRALFGIAGRSPEQLEGAILVAPAIGPQDAAFLYHAAGIVTTGGGVLSHAGLQAAQFGKPALVVSGVWSRSSGTGTLLYSTLRFEEVRRRAWGREIVKRLALAAREQALRDGDLVVLDADEGWLQVLGQAQVALALHDELQRLGEAARRSSATTTERQWLALRGRRLQALHQLQKLLARLDDPVLMRHAVHELLLGEQMAGAASRAERAQLLALALRNPHAGDAAVECLRGIIEGLAQRERAATCDLRRRLRDCWQPFEVLLLRLRLFRVREALEGARDAAARCGLAAACPASAAPQDLEPAVRARLSLLREQAAAAVDGAEAAHDDCRERHALTQLERLDALLDTPVLRRRPAAEARRRLDAREREALRRSAGRRVLGMDEAAFELHPLIGWKAANLAEIGRLDGAAPVPPWFVVTDAAFREALATPLPSGSLGRAIDEILARTDLGMRQQASRIRDLWEHLPLPPAIEEPVLAAYRALDDASAEPFVAVRSSSREEDAEAAARAGEFDTFLAVRGAASLVAHLKRAWAGLWTERAIYGRTVLSGPREPPGGGVIVQRVVWSRVSGVLQTVDAARGQAREIVIDAGLGFGEGVVGGTVPVDHFVVSKEPDLDTAPLRLRCAVGEKTHKVVFNRWAGAGTVRTEALYHERLRPALEHVELTELVRAACRIEAHYGYPLDIEFALEGPRLWLLQVRPVAGWLSTLGETLERYPLGRPRRRHRPRDGAAA